MQPQMQPPVADPNDHPDVPILPPFIYLGFFFLALLLDFIIPIDVFAWGLQFFLGMMLLSAGIGVMTFCVMRFTRAGTNVPPTMPTNALVTDSIYAHTRNPMYLSFLAMYLGLCFLFDLLWGFPLVVPLIYIVNTYVIDREEAYLTKKFPAYSEYRTKVPRWFGEW
jgi:protein-S-isoprenylcysteine O-methyltransferase Ste14